MFLWEASIYPVMGQGSNSRGLLPNYIAAEGTRKINIENDNVIEATTMENIKITLQRGDTLWALAQKYRTTVDKITKLNQEISPNQIREGEAIWVPTRVVEERKSNNVIEDVKEYSGGEIKTATKAVGSTAVVPWWKNIILKVPVVATFFNPYVSDLQPESKIVTYEIIVNNEDTLSNVKSSESMLGDKDETVKPSAAQKTVGTESQVLSRSLGRLVSKEDVELLTRVIYGEARGENFEGQVAVGAVVLNRLEDPRFPKTIRAIIYQSGAFTAVDDRQIHLKPDEQAYKAAEAALSGLDPTDGAIYYYNPHIATDRWIKTRTVIKRIGNHTFSI